MKKCDGGNDEVKTVRLGPDCAGRVACAIMTVPQAVVMALSA
jgi:hypothetical protein